MTTLTIGVMSMKFLNSNLRLRSDRKFNFKSTFSTEIIGFSEGDLSERLFALSAKESLLCKLKFSNSMEDNKENRFIFTFLNLLEHLKNSQLVSQ